MVKSLDSLKKIDPAEMKKYRKIILNYIGEKESAATDQPRDLNQTAPALRKVDGIINKISNFTREDQTAKSSSARLSGRARENKGGEQLSPLALAKQKERERLREVVKRQEEERKKIKAEEREDRINKERAEKAERWEEKIRLEEAEEKNQQRVRENIKLEKIKRQTEIERIKQEIKITRQAAREKKKIKQRRVWKKIERNFKVKFKVFYPKFKQNIIYIIFCFILILAIIYLFFCLAVLRLKIDNNFIGQLAGYLPVPAVITSQGIISYNDFSKIFAQDYLKLNLFEKKNYLAKLVVSRNLYKKYGFSVKPTNQDLAIRFVLDEDFNQIGLSRINKISDLLKNRAELEQLGKYADEYNDGAYYNSESAAEKFGPKVLAIAVDQTSKIMPAADGYYIIKRMADLNGQIGVKYLFVKAQTLDQYVVEESGGIKVFILAN